MGAKADIGWTTLGPDGIKRHVYAQHVGDQWKFFERPKRRGSDIEWVPMPEPPLEDWLELLDALETRNGFVPTGSQETPAGGAGTEAPAAAAAAKKKN